MPIISDIRFYTACLVDNVYPSQPGNRATILVVIYKNRLLSFTYFNKRKLILCIDHET